ncbi:NUDIX hydrolase [uncultured Corynebacterium sp.]|uniref:NUDIX hydrolase n=1 Tax=uncultured Corynebacterium sp. TaxID=159447 RepID=UPI0025E0B6A5|nr:NUDIX hydrolase [uncultured Corynebacterium sp.]
MNDDHHHDEPAISRREPAGTAELAQWPPNDGWVCNVVVRRGDRVLVLRRSPGGYLGDQWDLPGGKSEPGEEPAAAALREMTEETGLVGTLGDEVAHWSNPDTKGGDFRYHIVTFEALEIDDGSRSRGSGADDFGTADSRADVVLTREHSDYLWATREELAELPLAWHIGRVLDL